jgi:arsenite methyltransferase
MSHPKPDYGMDAPGVIRNLLLAAALALILSWVLPALHLATPRITLGQVTILFPINWAMFGFPAIGFLSGAALMIYYSKAGKFTLRDRILEMVQWRGGEAVLDVGTGRGLLMIGAAKKLRSGKAVGIDIWSSKDLSGNSMENTLRNADIEGVRERVEVQNQDATSMKFADNSFDVILSTACLHNIPSKEGREKACREIARVLKPGGKALIADFVHTGDYMDAFRSAGATAKHSGAYLLMMRIIEVQK